MKNKNKVYIIGIIIVLLFLSSAIIGSNESSEPTAPTTIVEEETTQESDVEKVGETDEEEPKQEPEITEDQQTEDDAQVEEDIEESQQVDSEYMVIGETYTSNIGMKMTPLEIGRTSELAPGGQYSEYFIYVLAEIENGSDEVIDVYQDTVIYIDDYQYESVYMSQIEVNGETGDSSHVDLNPGRKCKYIFYTSIPEEAVDANKVEFSVYGLPALLKENGKWIDDEPNSNATDNTVSDTPSDGIGNPVIDANPDRYIPEGITGELDVIDGTFYSNKPTSGIVSGEYLITGGGNGIITITDDSKFSLKFISNEVDFENADMEELINSPDGVSYQVYGNGAGYVVSFYEGGLYLYTDHVDDENDWAEGFYELLN